jgi:hypothetical protein
VVSSNELARVVEAARGLGSIPPRVNRWAHLPLCVLDAVYSIGAQYSGTARTVRAYATLEDLVHVVEPAQHVADGVFATHEQPVSHLRARIDRAGPETFAARVENRQRTSPRGGVLKAEATRQYAHILATHGVERLADVTALLTRPEDVAAVERDLAKVPGHGGYGLRTAYLWMLAGDDLHVKPDRMVIGWLGSVLDRRPEVREASALVVEAAEKLQVTPWELDHAIWTAQRKANAERRSRKRRRRRR